MPTACSNRSLGICPAWKPHLYQAYLFRERKYHPNTVIQHLGGIRFFYIRTLKQSWSADLTPYPKKVFHLPSLSSQDPAAQDGPDTDDLTSAFDWTQSPLPPLVLTQRSCTGQR